MKGSRFHDAQGNLLGEVPALDLLGPKYPPMNGITRPRLHAIFQEAVKRSGADIRLGVTVDEVGEDGRRRSLGRHAAASTTSSSARTASTRSVRRLVFPDAPEPEYTGQIVWRYNVPRPDGLDTLDMFVGANGKAGFVPLAPDLMYILYIEAVPPDEVKMPDERLAEIFRERLDEFGGPVGGGARPVHHRPGEGRRQARSSRCSCPPPWHRGPGRADRRLRPRDLASRRPGRRDGDRGRIVLAEEVTQRRPRGGARPLRRAALSALPGDLGDLAADRDVGDRAHSAAGGRLRRPDHEVRPRHSRTGMSRPEHTRRMKIARVETAVGPRVALVEGDVLRLLPPAADVLDVLTRSDVGGADGRNASARPCAPASRRSSRLRSGTSSPSSSTSRGW